MTANLRIVTSAIDARSIHLPPPSDRDPWMQTAAGTAFYPLDVLRPKSEDRNAYAIVEVAHALAKIERYSGHGSIDLHYSVAEHCVLLADYAYDHTFAFMTPRVRAQAALAVLLHDATEYVLGDQARPLKEALRLLDGEDYGLSVLHSALEYKLLTKFGVFGVYQSVLSDIKVMDTRILLTERDHIFAVPSTKDWNLGGKPLPIKLRCFTPRQARDAFLNSYYALQGLGGL